MNVRQFFDKVVEIRRLQKEYFKLSTVAKFLGVSVSEDSLHNALYDIELTRAVYDIVKR